MIALLSFVVNVVETTYALMREMLALFKHSKD